MLHRWLLTTAVLSLGTRALAAPCSELPSPVYVSSGAVSEPTLRALSPRLAAASGADQMTVVYVFSQTCDTLLRFTTGAALSGTGRTYDAGGAATQCDIPAGTLADLGVGNLFPVSCRTLNPAVDPSRVEDLPFVASPTVLIASAASDQFAISAEEAYFVYGFGAAGRVAPWVDDALIFRRTATAGTQTVIAQSINVPAARFLGVDAASVTGMITRVATAATPSAAIGFVSGSEADANRATVRRLAFRAFGQRGFYWPDSGRASFDRRNVRDGHYPLWNYEHAYVPVSSPQGSRGRRLAEMLTGARPLPSSTMTDVAISQGFIPRCAMEVQRSADDDGTSLSVYAPEAPCGCYFDANVPMGSTSCRVCTSSTECGTGACRLGYCEAR